MKHFRVVVLVLLAFLLPVRGALAAAMLCPGGGGVGMAVLAVEKGNGHGHGEPGVHDEHATGHHHPSHGDPSGGDTASSGGHQPGCQVCAGGCCVTPLAFALPSVAGPLSGPSVAFPAFSAPIAAFQSEGQDRPPRTL